MRKELQDLTYPPCSAFLLCVPCAYSTKAKFCSIAREYGTNSGVTALGT